MCSVVTCKSWIFLNGHVIVYWRISSKTLNKISLKKIYRFGSRKTSKKPSHDVLVAAQLISSPSSRTFRPAFKNLTIEWWTQSFELMMIMSERWEWWYTIMYKISHEGVSQSGTLMVCVILSTFHWLRCLGCYYAAACCERDLVTILTSKRDLHRWLVH